MCWWWAAGRGAWKRRAPPPRAAIGEWHGDAATIVDLLDGSERREDYDALILATPNVAESRLFDALAGNDLELHAVGDCVAPRWAVHAIYEGRKLGISL